MLIFEGKSVTNLEKRGRKKDQCHNSLSLFDRQCGEMVQQFSIALIDDITYTTKLEITSSGQGNALGFTQISMFNVLSGIIVLLKNLDGKEILLLFTS